MSDFSNPAMAQPATQGQAPPIVPQPAYTPQFVPQPAYAMQATGWAAPPQTGGGTGESFPPSSTAPMTAGLLVTIAGAASIILYMVLGFGTQTRYMGMLPGVTTSLYNSPDGFTGKSWVYVVSMVICGLVWIGVGVFIMLGARRRLATIAIVILVAYGLLMVIPGIEGYVYIQAQGHGRYVGGPVVGTIGSVIMPLVLMAAVAILIPAGNAAARGANAGGLKTAAVVLFVVVLTWSVVSQIITITSAHVAATSVVTWLLTSAAFRVGLLVLAAGIGSGLRPQPYVQGPLSMPQMTPVLAQQAQPITPQQWHP